MTKTPRKGEGEKMDLRNATEVDLQNELDRRAQERRDDRNTKQDVRVALVRKALPDLLSLVGHNRTSCSDKDFSNASRGCVRCALLELRDYDTFPYVLSIDICDFNENIDQE